MSDTQDLNPSSGEDGDIVRTEVTTDSTPSEI